MLAENIFPTGRQADVVQKIGSSERLEQSKKTEIICWLIVNGRVGREGKGETILIPTYYLMLL